MNRQRWSSLIMALILVVVSLVPVAGQAQEAAPAVTQSEMAPLPRDCDDVNPLDPPACCLYGYVYDGAPVAGASVTIQSASGSTTVNTGSGGASTDPYFRVDLSSAPLSAAPGQVLTVTASYSGTTSVRTWTVQSNGQQVDLGVYPQASTALFADDWATDRGWTNATASHFSRDATNEWLSWHVHRSTDEKYYIPIDPYSGDVRLEARVKATAWSNNCNLYFGLAEEIAATWPVGAFVSVGWFGDGVGNHIRPQISFSDGTPPVLWDAGNPATYVRYNLNTWYRIVLEIAGGDWSITVYDPAETQVGHLSGAMPSTHQPYRYAILFNPYDGDWPTGDGLFDDLTITAQSEGTSWPMFMHDARHTGRSPYAGPDEPYLKWQYAMPGGTAPAMAADGTIYTGGDDSRVHAIGPNGVGKWTYDVTNYVWSSPAVAADGTVYIGHNGYSNGNLLALNPNGSLKWAYPAREVRSSPTIGPDGTIYVGASDARLYAINPDGTLKWRYNEGFSEAYASPAVGPDGTIYITGTKEHNLHAVNPNGTQKWTLPIAASGETMSSPTVGSDGTIYVGGSDYAFYAVNPNGTVKWSYPIGSNIADHVHSTAIGPDGTLYTVSAAGVLYAFDPAGGPPLWTYAAGANVWGSPTVDANGVIYFPTLDGRIVAVNPDGTQRWSFQTPATSLGRAVTIGPDGTLYVGGNGVYAVGGEAVPVPPTAAFAGTPLSGVAPLAVQFADQSIGEVSSWTWTLGDGSTSGARHPSHVYASPGTYTVALDVTGPAGSDGESKTGYVVVNNPGSTAPVAEISYIWYPSYPLAAVQGQDTVYFNGSGYDMDEAGAYITAHQWTSSLDGLLGTQEDMTIPAAELSAGTHLITLRVQDDEGEWSPEASRSLTIQAAQADVRTLILVNGQKLASLHGSSGASQVLTRLDDLAAHDSVDGLVVRVENNAAVAAAYTAWSADPTSTARANDVAVAIKNLVDTLWDVYPDLEYLVIAGDDRAIPFRRVPDRTHYPEGNYLAVAASSTTGAALRSDMTLTDDFYADLVPTVPPGPDWDGHDLYIPDLGIGRLVETPAEIVAQIDTFLADDGLAAGNAIVSGYDFVSDAALAICTELSNEGLASDCSLMGDSWTADQFRSRVLGTRHDVVSVSGHANHYSLGAPTGSVSATDVAAATADHSRALFYTLGCHSGLNVPGNDAEQALDLAQAVVGQQASFIGNTGYGWGYRTSLGLSEQLMRDMTERLVYGQSATLGRALAAAKQEYYLSESYLDYYDEKVLIEATLYGLPMVRYTTATNQRALPASWETPAVTKRSVVTDLGSGLTVNSVSYQFPALLAQDTGEGQYYAFGGRVHARDGEPLQPKYVDDVSFPETTAHGVIFRGGAFQDQGAFNPVVERAITETTTLDEPAFTGSAWAPSLPQQLNRLERTETLVALLGQFNPETQVERLYDRLSFDLYYHTNSDDWVSPELTCVSSRLELLEALVRVEAGDASGVQAVVVAYTDGSGSWSSVELERLGGDPDWTGHIPAGPNTRYFVQVVDNAGNVSTSHDGGHYLVPGTGLCKVRIYLPLIKRAAQQ